MNSSRPLVGLATLLLSLAVGACVGPRASLHEATGAWRIGARGQAVAIATEGYSEFRDDNDLIESDVRAAADRTRAALESPVLALKAGPPKPPLALDGDGLPTGDALATDLRADLLSVDATRVARAIGVVQDLGLTYEAQALMLIIFRIEAFGSDGRILAESSVALRSVALKRLALDALNVLVLGLPASLPLIKPAE